jgi:hypothetical protein
MLHISEVGGQVSSGSFVRDGGAVALSVAIDAPRAILADLGGEAIRIVIGLEAGFFGGGVREIAHGVGSFWFWSATLLPATV